MVGDCSRAVEALVMWTHGKLAVKVDGTTHVVWSAGPARGHRSASARMHDYLLQQ